jgi:long-chain acyl-CoA synthetase
MTGPRVTGAARTLPALLAARVAATPSETAFREREGAAWRRTDWATFAADVARAASALHAAGLRRGDRLVLLMPSSLAWETLHHAAQRLGVAVVGLDAHDLPSRLAAMVAQARAAGVVVGEPKTAAFLSPPARAGLKLLASLRAPAPDDAAPDVAHWPARVAAAPDAAPAACAEPGDECTVIFTSGTTGEPKGIAYTHEQVVLAAEAIADVFPFVGPGSALLCWLPLSNLFQRMVNLAGLVRGAQTSVLPDPRRVMEVVAEVSPEVFVAVPRFYEKLHAGMQARLDAQPALLRRLVRHAWAEASKRAATPGGAAPGPVARLLDALVLARLRAVMGTRLRCLVSGSAPLPRHLTDAFEGLGWPVLEAYGLSENVLPMAIDRLDGRRAGSVGRPLPGNELRLGDDGVIHVRGPGVFRGYLDGSDPRDAEGFHRTGDRGRLDADGFLFLQGRDGDLIKTSTGRRLAPAAIEAELVQARGLDQVIVFGQSRRFLVALATPDVTGALPREAIEAGIAACAARLSAAERPAVVAVLPRAFTIDDGELTPNLKLRRRAIEERHRALLDALEAAPGEAGAAPRVVWVSAAPASSGSPA